MGLLCLGLSVALGLTILRVEEGSQKWQNNPNQSKNTHSRQGVVFLTIVTWLILPVVICLSQRLSHARVSTSTRLAKLRMAH